MSDTKGRKELSGLARSFDALFDEPAAEEESTATTSDSTEPTGELEGPEATDLLLAMSDLQASEVEEPLLSGSVLDASPPLTDEPASVDQAIAVGDLPTADAPEEHDAPEEEAPEEEAPEEEDWTELDAAVAAFLEGDESRSMEIQTLAADMEERREIDPVARAVFNLTLAAGDPPDPDIYSVALGLTSPVALGRLARHMGREVVEERREEYFQVCRTIGDGMALAIRDDLADTTDRLARRIHCQALREMGIPGERMVEEMAASENRFLVRNALSILGDMGGARAAELVMESLAHPDARVRREALLSLTKLEHTEAGDLVVNLLDDTDADVREAAAIAVGDLGVQRGLRPLLSLLESESDPERRLPMIRALGHLGDPGAVPLLEKQAVRSLLKRPPDEVRIAAYRALHQIGTPHAMQLLKNVASEKESDVKTAVKEMLYPK